MDAVEEPQCRELGQPILPALKTVPRDEQHHTDMSCSYVAEKPPHRSSHVTVQEGCVYRRCGCLCTCYCTIDPELWPAHSSAPTPCTLVLVSTDVIHLLQVGEC